MRHLLILSSAFILMAAGCSSQPMANTPASTNTGINLNTASIDTSANRNTNQERTKTAPVFANTNQQTRSAIYYPLSGFAGRVTKKPFGIHVTPKNSPTQPEHFSGYHTGADAETTDTEKNTDIPVYAIADGTIKVSRFAQGYGGVIIIDHLVGGKHVLALYSHVRLSASHKKVGDSVKAGEQLSVLGTGYSSETDGERKHLHFAIINGSTITLRGYVSTQAALNGWHDPLAWLQEHMAAEPAL